MKKEERKGEGVKWMDGWVDGLEEKDGGWVGVGVWYMFVECVIYRGFGGLGRGVESPFTQVFCKVITSTS